MGAQHTPGPWYVVAADEWRASSGHHAQWGRFDISAGSNDPAAGNYYRIGSASNVNNGPENAANARLIAAAPRMFSVIERGASAGDVECIAIVEAVNGNA